MQTSKQKIIEYYSTPAIMKAIFASSKDKEFVHSFVDAQGSRKAGSRPGVLIEAGDIIAFVMRGANEFHISVERWKDVLSLEKNKTKEQLDVNRSDWDFVIDIDVDEGFVYAKIIANGIVEFLVDEGLIFEDIFVKFSGNRGFHIALKGENFPDYITFSKIFEGARASLYPSFPLFILKYINTKVMDRLKQKYNFKDVQQHPASDLPLHNFKNLHSKSTPLTNLKLDAQVFSSRHLIRCPYSLHPKTNLVSLSISPQTILSFKKERAKIDVVLGSIYKGKDMQGFLDRFTPNSAEHLMKSAFGWFNGLSLNEREQILKDVKVADGEYVENHKKDELKINAMKTDTPYFEVKQHGDAVSNIPLFSFNNNHVTEKDFPPAINNILKGLRDGRKRALFILINFFRNLGFGREQIENMLKEWNSRNVPPLPEPYIFQQLLYSFKQNILLLPPSFSSGIYKELGVYEEDELTKKTKNPISYVRNKVESKVKYKRTKKGEIKKVDALPPPFNEGFRDANNYPPTINNILKGVETEREKALIILTNFFRNLGFSQQNVEAQLREWNCRNLPPLSEKEITQKIISCFMRARSQSLPTLCSEIYKKMKVYEEDELTKKMKNPISYVKRKIKLLEREKLKKEKLDEKLRNKTKKEDLKEKLKKEAKRKLS